MDYDRYVTICSPLLYTATMCPSLCVQMVAGSCITGFLGSFIQLCALLQLHFCGPNVIHHSFCDLPQLIVLSCSDTFFLQVIKFVTAVIFGAISILIIMISYRHCHHPEDQLHWRQGQGLQHLCFPPDSSDLFLWIRSLHQHAPKSWQFSGLWQDSVSLLYSGDPHVESFDLQSEEQGN